MDPWGTPQEILLRTEDLPLNSTYCVLRMMYYSVMAQAYSEKEIPSASIRSRTYDLTITSSDALPLSYRRLVGAKAIKPGSCLCHH